MAVSIINHNLVKTVYYNAGTDRTVLANRYNALCAIEDAYGREEGSVIMATVRYSGGYYYTYFFGPAGHDDIVMELQLYELNIWNINRSSGTYYVFGTTLTQRT